MKKLHALAGLCLLIFTGCLKEPGVPQPPQEQPEWLLTKIIDVKEIIGFYPDPDEYYKEVHEFKYNEQHKPWVHLKWISVADTSVLTLLETDTFFYDHQHRVTHIHQAYAGHGSREVIRFTYSNNERLPATEKLLGLTYQYTYYGDSMITSITNAGSPENDTMVYVYDQQGNYIGTDAVLAPHWEYDQVENVQLFVNADHGLVFRPFSLFIEGFDTAPRLSRNNWIKRFPMYHGASPRALTYNAAGLLSGSSWYAGGNEWHQMRYEYEETP
ncbi:hypothetical protein [Chitinophaga sp. XS-30]|uniref:hypothetical protein n=1 Tax=Chitinophaga sp. XS-30 TaxID=2604421 RepID=UPI0011DCBC4F|nr:hypothetical protein [Chitinophaga sp. XS-30]QEH42876.1 hypothetical protein FW415_19185 [Chitinophaga sp. XS-30]